MGTELVTWTGVVGAVLASIALSYMLFVQASPPREIVIAAGASDGEYYQLAQRYAHRLARHGIQTKVLETRGSVDNLKLLTDSTSGVSVGFVQGGVATPAEKDELLAIGSLYREPLWIFSRRFTPEPSVSDFQGKRIAIGAEGSGTRRVALQLLETYGLTDSNCVFLPVGGSPAAEQLQHGEIDVAFFVAGIDADYVRELGGHPEIALVSLEHHLALAKRSRYLSPLVVPEGLLNPAKDSPAVNKMVVAPTANLVVRTELHSAIVSVLLEAATQVHGPGDALSEPGEFPSPKFIDFPLSSDADDYYRNGPPLLQRLLPFWLAVFVNRIKLLALPLLMLVMPLIRATPPLLRWRIRRKIYLWYDELRVLDQLLKKGMSREEAQTQLHKLKGLESQLADVAVPLSYMSEYYNLRVHLKLVQEKLASLSTVSAAVSSESL